MSKAIKRTVKPAKLEANRRNALLSTGPKTEQGKERAKWNALEHGLLSKATVITTGDGKENPEEFNALLGALVEQYTPVGPIEHMLIERIAVCYWRLRRVQAAEVGETRKRLATAGNDSANKRRVEFYKSAWEAERRMKEDQSAGNTLVLALMGSSQGREQMLKYLEYFKQDLEQSGELSESSVATIKTLFKSTEFYELLSLKSKREKLKLIDEHIETEKAWLKSYEEDEREHDNASILACRLPEAGAARKILRYETAIDRQMHRAINELIRLQHIRLLNNAPMPNKQYR